MLKIDKKPHTIRIKFGTDAPNKSMSAALSEYINDGWFMACGDLNINKPVFVAPSDTSIDNVVIKAIFDLRVQARQIQTDYIDRYDAICDSLNL